MIGNISRLDTLRLPGEGYDNARCFQAKDQHSECMDSFKHLKGEENHYRCEQTLLAWKKACGPTTFRLQMEERDQAIRDNALFNQAQLKEYTRRRERLVKGDSAVQIFAPGK